MRNTAAAIILILGLSCTACTHSIKSDYILKKDEESIVIGQIILPAAGRAYVDRPLYGNDASFSFTTIMGRDSRIYNVAPDQSGPVCTFYIAVPQGRYRIDSIKWGELSADVKGIFTIFETGKVYYIGTIKMMVPERDPGLMAAQIVMDIFSHRRSVPVVYNVVDDFNQVTAEFKKKFPNMPGTIEKSLIKFKDPYQR